MWIEPTKRLCFISSLWGHSHYSYSALGCKRSFVAVRCHFLWKTKERETKFCRYFVQACRSEAGSKSSESAITTPSLQTQVESGKLWKVYTSTATLLTNLFPLWTLLVAVLALKRPSTFTWLSTTYFTFTLSILMLSMGITLSVRDFKRILKRPGIGELYLCLWNSAYQKRA